MRPSVRDLMQYLECLTLVTFLLRQVAADPDDLEADWGTASALERLAREEPASTEGWRLLARLTRHAMALFEERGDSRLVIAQQLHLDILARADAAALTQSHTTEA